MLKLKAKITLIALRVYVPHAFGQSWARDLLRAFTLLFNFVVLLPDLKFRRVSEEVARDGKNRIQPELKRITYNQLISRPKTRTTPKTAPPLMGVANNA